MTYKRFPSNLNLRDIEILHGISDFTDIVIIIYTLSLVKARNLVLERFLAG